MKCQKSSTKVPSMKSMRFQRLLHCNAHKRRCVTVNTAKKAYFFHQLVITCVSAFISTRTAYLYAQIHTCNSINTHPVAVDVCLANTWASATHETEEELHGKQLYTLNVGWTTHTSTHRDDNKLKRHKEQQKKRNRVRMCVTVEKIWWHQVNNHQRITFWSKVIRVETTTCT